MHVLTVNNPIPTDNFNGSMLHIGIMTITITIIIIIIIIIILSFAITMNDTVSVHLYHQLWYNSIIDLKKSFQIIFQIS
jgi:hypothetical protein